jgi:phosphoglycolate phosphatase
MVCYRHAVRLCVFDLDHTLVRSPLDLAAMALDMRVRLEQGGGALPPRAERYRVGELIAHCRKHAADLEAELWRIALDHERHALRQASLEPGAREAIVGAREAGFRTALWTNNAREITAEALARFELDGDLELVVTRDEMRALKPDPDGWRVIVEHFAGSTSADPGWHAVVVGDSWVDGLAAAAAGIPFVAYRANPTELTRWQVFPVAHISELAALPAWLRTHRPHHTASAPGTPSAG